MDYGEKLQHFVHCNLGKYRGSCKYGDDERCPALPGQILRDEDVAHLSMPPAVSLRDYFAAAALPQAVEDYGEPGNGAATKQRRDRGNPVLPYAATGAGSREEIIARQAYRYADAMLSARGKPK